MGGPEPSKLKLTILVTDDWGLMFESPKTGNSKSQHSLLMKIMCAHRNEQQKHQTWEACMSAGHWTGPPIPKLN